jgi:cyclic beta-1,2-glucan synthetase
MIYPIGIFFCAVFAVLLYMFTLVQSNKRGKFDIRAAKLDSDSLMWHARQLARNHEPVKGRESINHLLSRVSENYRCISSTYRRLSEIVSSGGRITGADEWLLDNFYIIEEQTKDLLLNIQKNYFKKLPAIKEGQYTGYPRVFSIALEFVSHTDSAISQQSLIDFISEYQKNSYLSDVEIWSISAMLKIGLIENIRHLCDKINKTQNQYAQANLMIDDIIKKQDKCSEVLGQLFKSGITSNTSLIEHLISGLKKYGHDGAMALKYIDSRLSKLNTTSEQIIALEHQKQTSRQVSMGNAITSLKYILALDYTHIFESLSQVEKILGADEIYAKMDKKTKNYYRRNVERIAKKMGISEVEVALSAIELAATNNRHVGYYLIESDLGKDNKKQAKIKQTIYWTAIALLTGLISAWLALYCYGWTGSYAIPAFVFLITLIPSTDIAIYTVNHIILKFTKVCHIPRLELTEGIDSSNATFVVISALLPGAEQAENLARQLEIYYLANKLDNVFFGLLGDYPDSKKEKNPEDKKILSAAQNVISDLNEKYPGKFYLFMRKRTFNKKNKIYMGWERKRGAIVELCALLRGEKNTSFMKTADISALPKIKYVITLDADTKLPRDTAKELIGAMSHPLNKPLISGGRVVSGYAILQPRINIDVESANTSFFSRVFAGQGGIDLYSGAVSDIYQDLFCEGIFTGKGIFDVDAFYKLLPNAIPENKILSHDLLEGSFLRCGLISDIEFIDGFPWKYSSYSARMHRWIRGDWQLLPWLLGTVYSPISALSKWKIFDNIRRSLLPVFLSLIILLSFNILPGSGFVWFGFAVFTVCFSIVISTLDWLMRAGYRYIGQRCNATIVYGIKGIVYEAALLFVLLPHYAYITIDAASRALFRMIFSKKKMLEWVTAAEAEKKLSSGLKSYFFRMISSCVYAAVFCLFSTEYPFFALPVSAVWFLAPVIMYYASKSAPAGVRTIKDEDKKFLMEIARRTWNYFDDFTTPSDNYLAPDNFQEDPPNGLAHRTSPTNIGLHLAAIVCAADLGFIDNFKMIDMLEKVTSTMQRLEKWNGHFYNWYNTKTLEVLRPRYVSTVDSGNLCGYIITVVQALSVVEKENPELSGRARDLKSVLKKIYDDTDFSLLYDRQRDLFTIGYNAEEEHITKSYYDLLSSEARMASFIAIAKGEIPKKHWFTLGRALVSRDGYKGLVSWTGTMFEYLMPLILMKNVKNTLLDETYHFVIRCQKKYGKVRNVPWGTSESGFNAFDIDLNYQYKAFGIPDLGLKRGLMSDMVVAPYASMMALMVDFETAMANIKDLKDIGILGKYGLYEAIDYTPERILPNQNYSVIKSYMVHHLGMSLLSINNVLNDNILQKRFHSDVTVRATQELLCERIPVNIIISKENKEKITPLKPIANTGAACVRVIESIDVNMPNVHILSNGKFSVMINDSGCGYSFLGDIALTRFRNDLQNGIYGNFIYIKDISRGYWWTNSIAPRFCDHEKYRAVFSPHKAEFFRNENGIDSTTEIIVSPEENAEIRKVTIANHCDGDIILDITNYQEMVLATLSADSAHPAFSNLFIRTEYDEGLECIIASRRPREADSKPIFAMQTICVNAGKTGKTEIETDRAKFIGRKKTLQNPSAMEDGKEMTNSVGAVLDPIMSQRFEIKIEKGSVASFAIITACCEDRDEALEIARKYKSFSNVERAFDMAWSRSQVENKYLGISAENEKAAYDMLANIVYILPYRRKLEQYISANNQGQQSLWSLGLSGDNPIVALNIYSEDETDILKKLLKAHELWRIKGITVDLVIITEDEGSYNHPLLTQVNEIVSVSHIREHINTPGGIFVIDGSIVSPEVKNLVLAASRVVLHSNMGDISFQLETEKYQNKIPYISFTKQEYEQAEPEMGDVKYFNGFGGFAEDEYVIKLSPDIKTPLPWCNVIAEKNTGFVVSESAGGFSWYHNSRENKLTPWTNDPVTDPLHEIIYLRDNFSGDIWTPYSGKYIVRHGIGYSIFESISCKIKTKLTVFVAEGDNNKLSFLEVVNTDDKPRSLTLTYYINPVLGVSESETKLYIMVKKTNNFITAQNSYNTDYPGQVVYVSSSEPTASFTCDKREFFGSSRLEQIPNGLLRDRLSNSEGSGYDCCIALQNTAVLNAGETKQIVFSLGVTEKAYTASDALALLNNTKKQWKERIGFIKINTPDEAMNLMVNSWLPYQTYSCRVFARSAFYQCGGAYGFRDQLQDVTALLYHNPQIAREQILKCASRQFVEGDVQHWWHEVQTGFKGIRTKFSDDLLWLAYTVSEYIRVTGDIGILDEKVPYIQSEHLCEGEDEKYCPAFVSAETGTIKEHCIKAIESASKFGQHGLPLMGSGDWNDGMNKVGAGGKGESVWLGWFLYDILTRFNYPADSLKESLNKAWDGAWYHRAYNDEGAALGSNQNGECKIDAIAQAWAVISEAGEPDKSKEAMDSVIKYLVNKEDGLIKLLTPPFDEGEFNPGYIKGYVPGVRENGGQYTHGAAWVILAFAKLGMGDTAAELYSLINPINHSRTLIEAAKYKAEPYVIAADVYTAQSHTGRGGWTWYTGAAGWMYRVAVEWILGIKKEKDTLIIDPCIPRFWKSYCFEYKYKNTIYNITVNNPHGVCKSIKRETISLVNDKQRHDIEITLQKDNNA